MSSKIIKNAYFYGFIGAAVLVILARFTADWINQFHLFSESMISIIQDSSTVFFATALYGEFFQSWKKTTSAQEQHMQVSTLLLSLGYFLTNFSFHLIP
jgi:hypothetical protein